MSVICFGSLNIDVVMEVDHFVQAGETLSSKSVKIFPGGKGLNQAIACARANADTRMAGKIGNDGMFLLNLLKENNVNVDDIHISENLSGTAYIQVDKTGQNSILLAANSKHEIDDSMINSVIDKLNENDYLLLQNEINSLDKIIDYAYSKNIKVCLNPSPMNENITKEMLKKVDCIILNEIEGYQITNEKEPNKIIETLKGLMPESAIVLTLGSKGSYYSKGDELIHQEAYKVEAVDTTAAGDTFTGYFLSGYTNNKPIKETLNLASKAAAIAVSKMGAATSIPLYKEVESSDL